MKKIFFGLSLFAAFSVSSCIQDEPSNSECDIEQARVASPDLDILFFNPNDAVKNVPSSNTSIVFHVRKGFTDSTLLEALPLRFKITPGATITPANGSPQNFRDREVTYTVTSEDKLWSRTYRVRFTHTPTIKTDLSFEDYEFEERNRYYEWTEISREGGIIHQWSTGNPGFAISKSSAKPEEYPTIPWTESTVRGSAVKLETRDTGGFGVMVNMRIAAGNLFIGTFDVANALKDPMVATRFGLPFNKKPLRFEGYYKFRPGEKFQNRKGTIIEGRVDEPDLYAVLYKNTDENGQPVTLKGDDVLTHPNIVALARIQNPVHDFNNWTFFNLDFEYFKPFDARLAYSYGYNLAVVFTSSIEGASFEGAVGSTLLIDEVRVICEE